MKIFRVGPISFEFIVDCPPLFSFEWGNFFKFIFRHVYWYTFERKINLGGPALLYKTKNLPSLFLLLKRTDNYTHVCYQITHHSNSFSFLGPQFIGENSKPIFCRSNDNNIVNTKHAEKN